MDMSGSQRIEASRETVWAALNNPEVLKACIPGCEEIAMVSPTEMTAKAVLKIGPVKATFGGKVTLSDLDPPNGYTITGEGQGGVAGFAKGGAKVRLEADGDATILHYEVKADVGGKIAQLGARLIDGTAKKLAGEFFETFGKTVGAKTDTPAEEAEAGVDKKKGWLGGLLKG
jgi:carbon monoxide dehydrogenase subunit G